MKKIFLSLAMLISSMTCMAQYKLETINYAGPSDIYTDIVFLGDGFTESELPVFVNFVKEQTEAFFQNQPWKTYRNRFNVFYVQTPSNESGAGMTPDAPIDNIFGVCFGTSGVDRMPWPTRWSNVYAVLNATKPDYDVVCIVVNSMKYGGGGGGGFLCYSMEKSSTETLKHEFGHAFGHLADEYWYRGNEAAPNMTQYVNPVKWENWLGYNSVGTYRYDANALNEGYYWYRPHQNCLMRYLNRDYCPVCMEALIETIHDCSRDVLSYEPNQKDVTLEGETPFSLNLLKPNPNTLRTEWTMDGQRIAHNADEVKLDAAKLTSGDHVLQVTVEDTTLLVRTTNHTEMHATTVSWNIKVEGSTAIQLVSADEANFQVGPLPFSDFITFKNTNADNQPIRMELYDMDGRKVAKTASADGATCTLNTPHTRSGYYILHIYKGKQLIFKRVILRE